MIFLNVVVNAAIFPNTFLKVFFWTQDSSIDSVKNGCYGYVKIESNNNYKTTLWLEYNWWNLLFPKIYLPCEINCSDTQPTDVKRSPNHFASSPWLSGFKRTDTTGQIIHFLFPLLPQNMSYGRYDYFSVDVNDTSELEFYGAGDSIMVGTFVHKLPDSRGAINILARNAFIIGLTKGNPLRISSIRCDAHFEPMISSFLDINLTKFKENVAWYGIDIIDTLSFPRRTGLFGLGIGK